ncbi:sensor histidine kinase [Taklimakanibacter deserti]|uniref:sensor histidine kinase n=1 Tax=Taklimakanibacter deserti TaxID=2267839 RepID=UPI000E649104
MRRDCASICTFVGGWTTRLGASLPVMAWGVAPAAAQGDWGHDFATRFADDPLTFSALFASAAVFLWAFFVIRKLIREEQAAERRARELETALNESEAILTAEPAVLMVWHGREGLPNRIAGDMRGVVKVPADKDRLLDFPSWLDAESAGALNDAVALMRDQGAPFNIGIRTLEDELLEADGRTAGGFTTLRLRPLAGERRQVTELAYDARRLGKQVERLSAVLDAAPFPIWLKDTNGETIWVNDSYIKAVEAADVDAVIANRIEIVDDSRIEPPQGGQSSSLKGRSHAVIGGTKCALDVHEIRLADGFARFAIDVTPIENARKELKRHIQGHASTLDKLDTAIAIFGPDQRLLFHNSAYAELWSLDPDWLALGPSDGEILDRLRELRRLPEQANYRDWKAKQLQAFTTLETRESWWYLPDGRSLRVICELHPFGGTTYLYENVTKEIQLESRYNELIGVQRETLDNLHEAVALFGTDGRLKLHNPAFARFWSLDPAFLDRQPHIDPVIDQCRKLLADDLVWDELKYGMTSLDTGRKPLKGRLNRPDGLALEYAFVPLPDGNALLTYVDVTDSQRIENALRERAEALEAADRLKTGFMSNVSYELRTPLTNILGFAESLSLGIAGDLKPKQQEYLRDIQDSSQDLLVIIDAILDLTTIDAGAMELRLSEIDVVDIMQQVGEGLGQWMTKRDLTLNIEVAEDAARFVGDPKRVQQILHNLLANAIGFSSEGGIIRMGAAHDGDDILLWVADTGRGIDPEFQKRVFDRFQSKPMPGGHRGPGLGLAIVKSFVELHGGRVSLRSQVNKGTTVICRFPMRGPHAQDRGSHEHRRGTVAA